MTPETTSSKKDTLAIILAAILWGTSFLFVKTSVDYFQDFFVGLFYRMLFAFLTSIIAFLIINFRILRTNLFYFKRPSVYILSILNIGGYFFQFLGATWTISSKIALLINATAIFVPIISYFLLKENFNYKKVVGIFIGVIGLIFLTTGGNFQTLLEGEFLGDLFCLIGGLFWAFYIVLSRKLLHDGKTDYKPLNIALSTTILSFIFLIPLVPFYSGFLSPTFTFTLQIWLELLYMGTFCTVLAYILYFAGMRSISATSAAFILLLEPTIAVILGIILLSEVFAIFSIIGAFLILGAIIIVNLS
ncbi:MAG: DMT family transporter [Candidatus Helarchaeota archaeon]